MDENVNVDGKMLKMLRIAANLQQQEMADLLGCSQVHVSRLELGKQKVSKKMKNKIRAILSYQKESGQSGK